MSDPHAASCQSADQSRKAYLQSSFTAECAGHTSTEGFWCPIYGSKLYHHYSLCRGTFTFINGGRSPGSICTLTSLDLETAEMRELSPILAIGGQGDLQNAVTNTIKGAEDYCAICDVSAESQVWDFRDEIFNFEPVNQPKIEIYRNCQSHGLDFTSIQPGILSFSNDLVLPGGIATTSPHFSLATFAPIYLVGESQQLVTLLHTVVEPFTCLSALSTIGKPLIVPQSQIPGDPVQGVGIADHQLEDYLGLAYPGSVSDGTFVRVMRIPQSGHYLM